MAEGQQIAQFFEAIATQVGKISQSIDTQQISAQVPVFSGNSAEFTTWMKTIDKFIVTENLTDLQVKKIAHRSAKGAVGDFITRWLRDNPAGNWATLRHQLAERFGEINDVHFQMSLLRKIRQGDNENVQIYAQKLLSKAEQALRGQDAQQYSRQLIGIFLDGLSNDQIRIRVMRENPEQFDNAVQIARQEQILQQRLGRIPLADTFTHRFEEPMEIDHVRPKINKSNCTTCCHGNHARQPDNLARADKEINAVSQNQPPRDMSYRSDYRYDRYANIKCWNCDKFGHIMRNCRTGQRYDNSAYRYDGRPKRYDDYGPRAHDGRTTRYDRNWQPKN